MSRQRDPNKINIDPAKFDEYVRRGKATGRLPENAIKDIAKKTGIPSHQLSGRRRNKLWLYVEKANELAALLECTVSDLRAADNLPREDNIPAAQSASASTLGPDHIATLYDDELSDSSLVCIFSMDGFLEAEPKGQWLFLLVYRALQKGVKFWYLFPDDDHAKKKHG